MKLCMFAAKIQHQFVLGHFWGSLLLLEEIFKTFSVWWNYVSELYFDVWRIYFDNNIIIISIGLPYVPYLRMYFQTWRQSGKSPRPGTSIPPQWPGIFGTSPSDPQVPDDLGVRPGDCPTVDHQVTGFHQVQAAKVGIWSRVVDLKKEPIKHMMSVF